MELDGLSGNIIGGTTTQDRNVITGNHGNGIDVNGSASNTDRGQLHRHRCDRHAGPRQHAKRHPGDGRRWPRTTPSAARLGQRDLGQRRQRRAAQRQLHASHASAATSSDSPPPALRRWATRSTACWCRTPTSNLIGQSNPVRASPTTTPTASACNRSAAGRASAAATPPASTSSPARRAPTACCSTEPWPAWARAIRSTIPTPRPPASTVPTIRAAATSASWAATRTPMPRRPPVKVNGFVFQGTTADLAHSSDYQTIDYPGAEFNYVHSTMGGLAVGNYDSAPTTAQAACRSARATPTSTTSPRRRFTADRLSRLAEQHGLRHLVQRRHELHDRRRLEPRAWSTMPLNQNQPIGQAYLVDYDSATGKFTNWTRSPIPTGPTSSPISRGSAASRTGVYTLSADSVQSRQRPIPVQGSLVTVTPQCRRLVRPGHLGEPQLYRHRRRHQFQFRVRQPGGGHRDRRVARISFQATVNVAFQLSNVISGNGGNGIELNAGQQQPGRHELHRHRCHRHAGPRQRRKTAS